MPTTHLHPDSAPGRTPAEPQSGANGATNTATDESRADRKAALLTLARALARQTVAEMWRAATPTPEKDT
jgi:hypothetical protein